MTAITSFDEFVKSPHDKSLYRLITLPNKLQAMLVSEPGLEKVQQPIYMTHIYTYIFTSLSCNFRLVPLWTFISVITFILFC